MKYPDSYKDREKLVASLRDKVIEELRYIELKINDWNDDCGFNRIIINNDDWYVELDIFVDGFVEEDSGDYYNPPEAWLKSVESHSEASIYLKDGEEEYEIEESLVNNLICYINCYIEDSYGEFKKNRR